MQNQTNHNISFDLLLVVQCKEGCHSWTTYFPLHVSEAMKAALRIFSLLMWTNTPFLFSFDYISLPLCSN